MTKFNVEAKMNAKLTTSKYTPSEELAKRIAKKNFVVINGMRFRVKNTQISYNGTQKITSIINGEKVEVTPKIPLTFDGSYGEIISPVKMCAYEYINRHNILLWNMIEDKNRKVDVPLTKYVKQKTEPQIDLRFISRLESAGFGVIDNKCYVTKDIYVPLTGTQIDVLKGVQKVLVNLKEEEEKKTEHFFLGIQAVGISYAN